MPVAIVELQRLVSRRHDATVREDAERLERASRHERSERIAGADVVALDRRAVIEVVERAVVAGEVDARFCDRESDAGKRDAPRARAVGAELDHVGVVRERVYIAVRRVSEREDDIALSAAPCPEFLERLVVFGQRRSDAGEDVSVRTEDNRADDQTGIAAKGAGVVENEQLRRNEPSYAGAAERRIDEGEISDGERSDERDEFSHQSLTARLRP